MPFCPQGWGPGDSVLISVSMDGKMPLELRKGMPEEGLLCPTDTQDRATQGRHLLRLQKERSIPNTGQTVLF